MNALAPIQVWLDERQNITGPFTRTIERRIRLTNEASGTSEEYSAGQLCQTYLIRDRFNNVTPQASAARFLAELKQAGVL
jgi:hypothetical protein